jgi:peroxiredoxin
LKFFTLSRENKKQFKKALEKQFLHFKIVWDAKFVFCYMYQVWQQRAEQTPTACQLHHKTCDILAAERLRLMRFDNRLIIDSFQKAIFILKW